MDDTAKGEILYTNKQGIARDKLIAIDDAEIIKGFRALFLWKGNPDHDYVEIARFDNRLAITVLQEPNRDLIEDFRGATLGERPGPEIPYMYIVIADRWWKQILSQYKPRRW